VVGRRGSFSVSVSWWLNAPRTAPCQRSILPRRLHRTQPGFNRVASESPPLSDDGSGGASSSASSAIIRATISAGRAEVRLA
jgi:hypothetical protein